ncbi:variable surface lipoprotein [Mycoplasma struthionis]|uniref:Variable surface lipoprotein n=1 Tax=Mycoplasma struthionis TaxID=538220 RepID=A0A502M2K8_9MOLU|nr:variable surface lipoprotein [Mycoplasma struthionis]
MQPKNSFGLFLVVLFFLNLKGKFLKSMKKLHKIILAVSSLAATASISAVAASCGGGTTGGTKRKFGYDQQYDGKIKNSSWILNKRSTRSWTSSYRWWIQQMINC